MVAGSYKPSFCVEHETGVLGVHWPASLATWMSLRFNETLTPKMKVGAGATAQWPRTLAVPAQDTSYSPSTHIMTQPSLTIVLGEPNTLF